MRRDAGSGIRDPESGTLAGTVPDTPITALDPPNPHGTGSELVHELIR